MGRRSGTPVLGGRKRPRFSHALDPARDPRVARARLLGHCAARAGVRASELDALLPHGSTADRALLDLARDLLRH